MSTEGLEAVEASEVRMSFGWPLWVYMVPGTLLLLCMAIACFLGGMALYGIFLLAVLFFSYRLHRRSVVRMDRDGFRTFFVWKGLQYHSLASLTGVVVPKARNTLGPYALVFRFQGWDGRPLKAVFEVGARRNLDRVLGILQDNRPELLSK